MLVQTVKNVALRGRVKKSYKKAQQEEAFKELLKLMDANRGKLAYDTMDKLIKKYQNKGLKAINQQNLYYRLKKMIKQEKKTI
jgi:hypothetical protein